MNKNLLQIGLILFFGILGGHTCLAQMYVSSNSYVYANNQFMYVTQDVNLASDGNIYLRNQSQLLQGTTAAGANQGLGNVSVYQEGTTNNFQYNYWCSPVGVPDATAANSNFGITRLHVPSVADKVTSVPATIITGTNGVSGPGSLSISNRWIWKYIAQNIYAPGTGGWVFVGSGATVEPGLGFSMKGTSGTDNLVSDANDGVQNKPNANYGQRYDFRGKPNDGNMSATVSNVNGASYINLTLVGNPYPSAINLNHYLLENSGYTVDAAGNVSGTGAGAQINNTAYFWEHDKSNNTHLVGAYVGGYGTYTPNMTNIANNGTYASAPMSTYSADGESTTGGPGTNIGGGSLNTIQRQFTPVGQGFMVHGAVASGTVTMRNKYRVFRREGVANNSQFERNSGETANVENEFWEDVPNVAGIDYTQIRKNVYDPKFKIHTTVGDVAVYEDAVVFGSIASENYDFFDGICPYTSASKVAYLTTKDGAEKLTISAQPFDIDAKIPMVFVTNEQVTFKVKVSDFSQFDLAENIFLHDKETGLYHDIKNGTFEMLLPAGTVQGRFEVTFRDATLSIDDSVISSLEIYQNNDSGQLTIKNPLMTELKSCEVFDVAGKQIFAKKQLGNDETYEFSTGSLSEGVYIVRLNTKDDQQLSKKVIVKK